MAGEPFADNCDITFPVLVNTIALAAGDELKVHWVPRPAAAKEPRGAVTWATQARRQLNKSKKP